ncbi:G patch domain-containing protein 8, partial [Actinomortierella wolfii]
MDSRHHHDQHSRFYRQELKEFANTTAALRSQFRPSSQDGSNDPEHQYASLDSSESDNEDYVTDRIDMETHLPSTNIGYQLLLKMGWKAGDGLGRNRTGRTDPIPITKKDDFFGVGKKEVEIWDTRAAAKRKVLEVEKQAGETEEERTKRKEAVRKRDEIQAELAQVKAAFYCALCDKQYERISEYEGHLNSYDHHHKKRFKEMKESSRAGASGAIEKAKEKERKREEKELARMRQAALERAGIAGTQPSSSMLTTTQAKPNPAPMGASASGTIGGWTNNSATPIAATPTTTSGGGFKPVQLGSFKVVKPSISSNFSNTKSVFGNDDNDDSDLNQSTHCAAATPPDNTPATSSSSILPPAGSVPPVKLSFGFN